MVDRNAQNFILLSRSGAKTKTALALIAELSTRGISIEAPECDISDETAVIKALSETQLPPVKGCIQAAMVLKVHYCSCSLLSSTAN